MDVIPLIIFILLTPKFLATLVLHHFCVLFITKPPCLLMQCTSNRDAFSVSPAVFCSQRSVLSPEITVELICTVNGESVLFFPFPNCGTDLHSQRDARCPITGDAYGIKSFMLRFLSQTTDRQSVQGITWQGYFAFFSAFDARGDNRAVFPLLL